MPTILRNDASEAERTPASGGTPRPCDTSVTPAGAPDPDLHREAAADAAADSEAGARPEDGGGITPLKRRD